MKSILQDEKGSILTEYGLLLVIIALSLIAVLGIFRDTLIAKFDQIVSQVNGVNVK